MSISPLKATSVLASQKALAARVQENLKFQLFKYNCLIQMLFLNPNFLHIFLVVLFFLICLSFCVSIRLYVCLPVFLCGCLSVCSSVCSSVSLSVCLDIVAGPNCLRDLGLSSIQDGTNGAFYEPLVKMDAFLWLNIFFLKKNSKHNIYTATETNKNRTLELLWQCCLARQCILMYQLFFILSSPVCLIPCPWTECVK